MSENWTALWILISFSICCSIATLIIQIRLFQRVKKLDDLKQLMYKLHDHAQDSEIKQHKRAVTIHDNESDTDRTDTRLRNFESIQEFIHAVGAYIGQCTDSNREKYCAEAAKIYLHIPSEYWDNIRNIEQAISDDNMRLAQEYLIDLSKRLAV